MAFSEVRSSVMGLWFSRINGNSKATLPLIDDAAVIPEKILLLPVVGMGPVWIVCVHKVGRVKHSGKVHEPRCFCFFPSTD